ncbi:MAG: DUF4428 domain-containing protein [Erysipelotrichaceae bacterium]|nr:DUF4428 domain-containing protein [Erysipelotrichaceae bacterium]
MLGNNAEKLGLICSVCGKPYKPFGNRKLKDGILCRSCNRLISPWFTDEELLQKTSEDMKEHLLYREKNKELFNRFVTTREVDEKYSICIDDADHLFYVNKNSTNPDILPLEDFETISIFDRKYPDNENGVDVFFRLDMKHQEYGSIEFRINEFPCIEKGSEDYRRAYELGMRYMNVLLEEVTQ